MKYSTRRLEEIDGVNKYQAARYLYDFLRENDLVQLKKAFKSIYSSVEYPVSGSYLALIPLKEGEYLTKDGKAKFVLKKIGGSWWLYVDTVDGPTVEESATTNNSSTIAETE